MSAAASSQCEIRCVSAKSCHMERLHQSLPAVREKTHTGLYIKSGGFLLQGARITRMDGKMVATLGGKHTSDIGHLLLNICK